MAVGQLRCDEAGSVGERAFHRWHLEPKRTDWKESVRPTLPFGRDCHFANDWRGMEASLCALIRSQSCSQQPQFSTPCSPLHTSNRSPALIVAATVSWV